MTWWHHVQHHVRHRLFDITFNIGHVRHSHIAFSITFDIGRLTPRFDIGRSLSRRARSSRSCSSQACISRSSSSCASNSGSCNRRAVDVPLTVIVAAVVPTTVIAAFCMVVHVRHCDGSGRWPGDAGGQWQQLEVGGGVSEENVRESEECRASNMCPSAQMV